jgi:hypothetical protein
MGMPLDILLRVSHVVCFINWTIVISFLFYVVFWLMHSCCAQFPSSCSCVRWTVHFYFFAKNKIPGICM